MFLLVSLLCVLLYFVTNKKTSLHSPSSKSGIKRKNESRQGKITIINLADISLPKPNGTYWDAPGNVIFDEKGINVVLGNVLNSKKIEISLDNNEDYEIFYFLQNVTLGTQIIKKRTEPGLQGLFVNRYDIPKEITIKGFDKLQIVPHGGDGMFSLGHILFLD